MVRSKYRIPPPNDDWPQIERVGAAALDLIARAGADGRPPTAAWPKPSTRPRRRSGGVGWAWVRLGGRVRSRSKADERASRRELLLMTLTGL
jgi:hypothetical protein